VKEILDLPYTPSSNPNRILEFYEKLAYCVQSLETLKKLDAVNWTISMTYSGVILSLHLQPAKFLCKIPTCKIPNLQNSNLRNSQPAKFQPATCVLYLPYLWLV
jgi:hypothetical protein